MGPLSYRYWTTARRIWHQTGNFLSSQGVATQVLSASECLTTVFGMGTGGTIQLSSPDLLSLHIAMLPQNYTEVLEMKPNNLVLWLCGQHQPIIFVLRTRFLGCFRISDSHASIACGSLLKISPRHISTGPLHSLRNFHSQPINLIISEVPY